MPINGKEMQELGCNVDVLKRVSHECFDNAKSDTEILANAIRLFKNKEINEANFAMICYEIGSMDKEQQIKKRLEILLFDDAMVVGVGIANR